MINAGADASGGMRMLVAATIGDLAPRPHARVEVDAPMRTVVEEMRSGGYTFGGEQSGHLIFLDHATTGDGIVAALQVLAIMIEEGTGWRLGWSDGRRGGRAVGY